VLITQIENIDEKEPNEGNKMFVLYWWADKFSLNTDVFQRMETATDTGRTRDPHSFQK
jgi:hypothetical protein